MKKRHYNLLVIISALFFMVNVIGQTNNNGIISYQKVLKYTESKSISEAKEEFIKEFGLDNNSTFVEIQSNRDKTGAIHTKLQQYYQGIKVEYGTMIVHSKEENITSINGELYNPEKLNLTSNLSATSALQKAISQVDAKSYLWTNAEAAKSMEYKKPVGELVIFPVLENGISTLKLAYKFDIYATVPVSRGYIYINAHDGSFLFNEPIIKHFNNSIAINNVPEKYGVIAKLNSNLSTSVIAGTADTRYSGNQIIETRAKANGKFTLNDDSRNVHTYNAQNSPTNGTYQFTTVDFEDDNNVWTAAEYDNAARDNAALDAHWGAIKVFDFWNSLGRNSINGKGMEIRSYVHVGTDFFNAFWNGTVMSYGDGTPNPLTSIDIVSHEIAHGVTTWTANLVYARESGAMNEGFSDIFGAAVEFFAKGTGTNTNPNSETWLLAEDFWPGGFLRSMSNPKSKGDPDSYNGTNYTDASSNCIPSNTNDFCGVHSNSGVLNHWFYILVVGKSGTNDAGDVYNVTGIGMTKAQEIAYLTLRDYLLPNSTFIDARNAAIEVAASLYGSNSVERKATQDAFYAVNVGEEFIPFATDLKLVEFTELVDISCGGAVIPKIKVRNSGVTNPINTIQIKYAIDGIAQTPFNWNGTLAVDAEVEIILPQINKVDIKTYNLQVETVVAGDGDSSNNSLTGSFRINRSDNLPITVNTFDNFLADNWLTYNEGAGSNLWLIGAPNKANLNTVTSGSNAYVTGTTSNYPNDTKAYLISPCYDLTSLSNPTMKFNMAFKLQENFDIVYVEYSTDAKNWTLLGSATDPNWYNSNRIFESGEISVDCQNCPGAQWTGSNTVFSEYSYDLSAFTAELKIIFRFVFHSNASITDEGVVIDDFIIEQGTTGINDADGDGVLDVDDLCANTPAGESVNVNGCSNGQLDDDNDGVQNSLDLCPATPNGESVNASGCSQSQIDDDNDGVMNNADLCANTPAGETVNTAGCSNGQLDDDNDGVLNDVDQCPNSTVESLVNSLGCFTLPNNNFAIEVTGETCPGKNNGKIKITAQSPLNYTATINGAPYSFTSIAATPTNLAPGIYDFCIAVTGEIYSQCFTVEVVAGVVVSGKASVDSNKVSVEIEIGTAPYIVYVNGQEKFQTSAPKFSVDVNKGDILEVKTAVSCEGVFSKNIEAFNEVTAFPNPTQGAFEIAVPTAQTEVTVELYNISSQLISAKKCPVVYGKVQISLENKPTGIYIAKVLLDKPISIKIIKQ